MIHPRLIQLLRSLYPQTAAPARTVSACGAPNGEPCSCGCHESSWDLRCGLEIREHAWDVDGFKLGWQLA